MGEVFPERILAKWDAWKQKGRFPADLSIGRSIEDGKIIWLKPDVREAISWLFNIKDKSAMWVRANRLTPTFTLIAIGYGGELIEVCSWRSMRQMGKAWVKLWVSVNPSRRDEATRLFEIFKFKFITKIQGGLIRGEHCPRVSAVVREHSKSRFSKMKSEYLEPNLDVVDV